MAGRRLRAVGSTHGHRVPKAVVLADTVDATAPEPPLAVDGVSPLLPEVESQWREFWRSPAMRAIDLRADAAGLRRLFQAIDERLVVAAAIARERLVAGSRGQPRLNPLVAYEAQLTREIERGFEQFGMTPLARFRLGIEAGEAANALEGMRARLDRIAGRAQPLPRELAPDRA